VAYLKAPSELDWQGVDTPSKLAELTKKGNVEMVVKDASKKDKPKTHRYKIKPKNDSKKEPEKPKELAAKEEANNPIKESSHKLPSVKEILERAQEMYMAENFKPIHDDSAPETLPTKGELSEEGYLQKAKLALMTSQDTRASRKVMDYVEGLRNELSKIGFDVVPIAGFDSSDLKF
jgi:hypothetical protein